MRYDFDTPADRSGTFSLKWDIKDGELPMWVADMDFKAAPEIVSALQKRLDNGVFGYTVVPGEWADAYIGWWSRRHGILYKREKLIFATGVVPILSSCIRKLTTPGENVVIMTPVYNAFFNCILNNGCKVLECPLDAEKDYSVNWPALEKALADPQTTLMILCDPQNPVGRIWDRETLARIGELAYDNGVVVISDEIHCDITDPGKEYVPFASVSEKCRRNCIVCLAPTKAFNLAGLQTAAAAVPDPRLRHKVRRALNTDEVAEPGAFAIQAAIAAFDRGEAWLDELRQYIFENKLLVREYLEKHIPEIRLVRSDATYLLWLDFGAFGLGSEELARFVRGKTGLFLSEGQIYGNAPHHLRMNIACPRSAVKEGLRRLSEAAALLRERREL